MATQSSGPPKVPLIADLSQRANSTSTDARIVNGYVEKDGDAIRVVKRPGLASYIPINYSTPGGQGLFNWSGNIYFAAGGAFFVDDTPGGRLIAPINNSAGLYYFSSNQGTTPQLYFHNTFASYKYDFVGGIQTVGLLQSNLAGVAYLDGTTYILTPPNNIRGSGINDLATWDALNTLKAQQEPDKAIYITKQLSYVVVLKEWTTEAFYDAGNPVGSPLSSAPGTLIPYGCRSEGSVQCFENAIIWLAQSRSGSVSVMVMEGLQARVISTPAVERLLEQWNAVTTYSFAFRVGGHRFYGVSLPSGGNITLVCDLTTGVWSQWTDTNSNYWPILASAQNSGSFSYNAGQPVVQDKNGSLYFVEVTNYTDAGVNFPFEIYTPIWDGGVRVRKTLMRMTIKADQANSGTLSVSWSDDDYQTWSPVRLVDLSDGVARIDNCGTFYKRAWHISYTGAQPLRIQEIELTNILMGTM